MKTLRGQAHNLTGEILGKIVCRHRLFQDKSRSILLTSAQKLSGGYAGFIAVGPQAEAPDFSARPYVHIDSLPPDALHEGDVVLMEPDGSINVLYKINSSSNALVLTERCNHRCIMCPQPPVTHEDDLTPFNLQLLSLFDKHTREIGLTGGEPTLAGDNLFVILNYIKQHFEACAVTILTNGVKFADKGFAAKLAACQYPDLQIDVPLYADLPELHNHIVGARTFYRTVQGLYNLALFSQRVCIRVVIHKMNYDRLEDIAYFIYRNFPFVAQVAFIQMEVTGLAREHVDKLWIDPYNYSTKLKKAIDFLKLRNMPAFIYNAQLCLLPEDIRQDAVRSISGWKNTFLKECAQCALKDTCPGLFATSDTWHSQYIKAIRK